MSGDVLTGSAAIRQFAGKDLNQNGKIINLVVSGNSRFYDSEWIEEQIESWIGWNSEPDLIILGGASGVDYLVEKWANEKGIPMAIFSEAWNEPRGGLKDPGRPEASPTTVSYTHLTLPTT